MASIYDVVIPGGGVAGLTAGMYASRYGLKTAIIERLTGGYQIINVEKIETFPGFPQGVSGAELGPLMQEQAMNSGAEFLIEEATGLALDGNYRVLTTTQGEYRAKALILAAGSRFRKLGIPGEEALTGKGVAHCATCDGPLYSRQIVGVVGGGDSAADEALSLTQYADKVILFHRRDRFRAQSVLQQRLMNHAKIDIVYNTVVESIVGDDAVQAVQIRNVVTNLEARVDLSALFVYVGLQPNTEFVRGVLKTDKAGHIPVNLWMATDVPGIYAAGDIRAHSVAQLASSAGDGATAAIAAFRYITGKQWPRR